MFITKENENLQVHLNATDMEKTVIAGEVKLASGGALLAGPNIQVTLSPDKAKELEDKLEKALKEK